MNELKTQFTLFTQHKQSLEAGRNHVRKKLHDIDAESFPYGQMGGHIDVLVHYTFGSKSYSIVHQLCNRCNALTDWDFSLNLQTAICSVMDVYPDCKWSSTFQRPYYVQDWLQFIMMQPINKVCEQCEDETCQYLQISLTEIPPLIYFNLYDSGINVSSKIFFHCNGEMIKYTLKGLSYFGGYHFTSRFISGDGSIYYHDGMTCGNSLQQENMNLDNIEDQSLRYADNKRKILIGAIYIRD